MYSTSVSESSQPDVIRDKLMSLCDEVKKGRVSSNDLREVIDLCIKNDYQLPSDTGLLLLRCCGNLLPDLETTKRDFLANQILCLVKKNGAALTLEHYNTLLGINEENSKFVNPKEFLIDMNVTPDKNTYRLLLNAATKAGNNEYLWNILTVIKDKNLNIYEDTISSLVHTCLINDNVGEVERTLALMKEAKLSTTKAYTELALEYAKRGNIPNLVKILNEEPQSNVNLLKIIKTLSLSNNSRHIPVVLNFLMTSVPEMEFEISKMIIELMRAGQIANAHTIINYFALNNVTKDIVQKFVNSFMNESIILNVPIDDIVKYANDFIDSGCSLYILTNVAEIGLKLGREKMCLAIFDVMKNKNIEIRPHYYWPLLLRAHHNKGEAEIYLLVKSMVNDGVDIDFDTLCDYILPYVNTGDPVVTLKRLAAIGVSGTLTITPMLSFLLHNNRVEDVMQMCTLYHSRYKVHYKELIKPLVRVYLDTNNVKLCVKLLTSFSQGQDFARMFLKLLIKSEYQSNKYNLPSLLEEFKKCKIKISSNDAIFFKNKLSRNESFNNVETINLINNLVDPELERSSINMLEPKYMNTKELSCYLMELKGNKIDTKNILHKLLIGYCIEKNLQKAEEIKQEYDACQYEWTVSMKSILFELYLKHGKLNEAEALLPDLQITSDKYAIDTVKIMSYAIALVKANNPAKAFDVIQNFIGTNTKIDVHLYCCTLLETLAQSRYHIQTINMLDLLLKKNYCSVSEELLKPLMQIPLEYNDILNAVNTLLTCAQKYKKMPLVIETLSMLLKQKENKNYSNLENVNEYVEQVYNAASEVYSVTIANTFLAIALAILKKREKVHILLQNYDLSMNCFVHYINNTKSIEVLDGILSLIEIIDEKYVLNKNVICTMLISAYSKMGDCKRVLKLWNIMCTKNILPDALFEKRFTAFLLANKIPLPPELKNKKKINASN
ncbi:hypothetical protein PUN28_009012 [Cardiocondyla obscurior]